MRSIYCLPLFALLAATPACADGMGALAYGARADVQAFIADLVRDDALDAATLAEVFANVEQVPRVLELIKPPTEPKAKSWRNYRAIFIEPRRIAAGRAFMARHATPLARAEARYGVPREIIAAVIGVETMYGQHTGKFNTLAALSTLAFDYPPRAALFRRELRELLLLARDENRAPDSYAGSFAGALGLPQFLPSSIRAHAVDFDRNGSIDLLASAEDAIGSVANYLAEYGWQRDQPIATTVSVTGDVTAAVAAGIEPTRTPAQWQATGLQFSNYSRGDTARGPSPRASAQNTGIPPAPLSGKGGDNGAPVGVAGGAGNAGDSTPNYSRGDTAPIDVAAPLPDLPAALIDLPSPDAPTEYRLGFRNFYVITRYNHSSNYAAAVMDLATALK